MKHLELKLISTKDKFLILILFIIFFSIYTYIGVKFNNTSVFSSYDVIFQADIPRVIGDMTEFGANHYRTSVHPFYVLLLNPVGNILNNKLIKNPALTAIFINSLFGAFSVFLCAIFFCILHKDLIFSIIISMIYGFSMSQLIWGSVPETYSIGSCSLLLGYISFIHEYKKKI